MAETCIQERFDCCKCGTMLLRLDLTAPQQSPQLMRLFSALLNEQARLALQLCDDCLDAVQAVQAYNDAD